MTDDKSDTTEADPTDEQHTTPGQGDDGEQEAATTDSPGPIATRRGVLTSAGLLGLLGLGAGTASAAGDSPSGQIGTDSNPLNKLYTKNLYGSDGTVKLGANLDTNGNNLVRPVTAVSSATTISAGDYFVEGDTSSSGFTITLPSSPSTGEEHIIKKKNGSNSLTIDGNGNNIDGSSTISLSNDNDAKKVVYDGSEWHTQSEISNGGSSISKLETSSNSVTALTVVEANKDVQDLGTADQAPNIVAGAPDNNTNNLGPIGIVIAGGGDNGSPNIADHDWATVSGGNANKAQARRATVGGGQLNKATGQDATVAGGYSNEASGTKATVPGGRDNDATGDYSLAAGSFAKADNNDAFVWSDRSGSDSNSGSSGDQFASSTTANMSSAPSGANTFSVKATSGVRFVTSGDNKSHAYIDSSGNLTTSGNVQINGPGTGSSSDNLLAIDSSGNVQKASSTTLSDVGGSSPSSLVTSSNSVTAVEVIDGSSSVSTSSDSSTPPNVIGGHPSNNTGGNTVKGVTIAGGGGNSAASNDNTAGHNWATIGGGKNNTVKNAGGIIERGATIGGGIGNTTDSSDAPTVGGGQNNTAARKYATVAGGKDNKAGDTAGTAQTVGGGSGNEAIGSSATIPGGFKNRASGASSFAAGNRAVAADDEAFVWNDGTKYSGHSNSASGDGGFNSSSGVNGSGVTGANTFSVSASSGVRFVTGSSSVTYIPSGSTGWSTSSSRAFKTNIDPVDTEQILDGVTEMEVATWEYEDDDGEGQGVTHIGPMAEDFHEILDVGSSDEHINSLNADGMAFAAIQGLATKLDATRADIDAKDARIEEQQDRIERLESKVDNKDVALDALREALDDKDERIDDLEAENEQLRERNAELEDRLAAVEAELGIDATASQQGVADD